MNRYYFLIQNMPTDPAAAAELSLGMSNKYGMHDCELISSTIIPGSNPPRLLLAFQRHAQTAVTELDN